MALLIKEEQHKQTLMATELERLRSSLNPHFLFNSLSSLKYLIRKDTSQAIFFVKTLSSLYRYLLMHEVDELVLLKDELNFANDYINLQKIRFSNNISINIDLGDYYLNFKVFPISIQLLIENCIKHNKISDNEPINISITAVNEYLIIENNYNPREGLTNNTGKGIENIIKRYLLLTEKKCLFEVINGKYSARIPLIK